jgi:hypothetical protein
MWIKELMIINAAMERLYVGIVALITTARTQRKIKTALTAKKRLFDIARIGPYFCIMSTNPPKYSSKT